MYFFVFLDLLMPGMTGAETFTAMRERKFDSPVVIITGYPDSSLMAQLLEAGPVAMLRKPFTQQDIHETIQRFAQPQTSPSVAVR